MKPRPKAPTVTLEEVLRALKGEGVVYYGLGDKYVADEYQRDLERARLKRRRLRARPSARR